VYVFLHNLQDKEDQEDMQHIQHDRERHGSILLLYPVLAGALSAFGIFMTAVSIKVFVGLLADVSILARPLTWIVFVCWITFMLCATSLLNTAMEKSDAQHVVPIYFAVQVLTAVLLSFTMWEEYSSFTKGMPLTLLFPLGLIITFVGVYLLNSSAVNDDVAPQELDERSPLLKTTEEAEKPMSFTEISLKPLGPQGNDPNRRRKTIISLSPSDTVVMMASMPAAEALAPLDEVPGLLQRERGDSDPSTYFAVPGTPISPSVRRSSSHLTTSPSQRRVARLRSTASTGVEEAALHQIFAPGMRRASAVHTGFSPVPPEASDRGSLETIPSSKQLV